MRISRSFHLAAPYVRIVLCLAGCLPYAACASSNGLLRRFAADTGCQEGAKIHGVGASAYDVVGCDTVRRYSCLRDGWGRYRYCQSDEPAPVSNAYSAPAPAAPAATPASQTGVSRRVHAEGYPVLEAIIAGSTRVRIVAAPTRDRERLYFSFVRDNSSQPFPEGCEVRLVADGNAVSVPSGRSSSEARRQELGIQLPIESLAQMAKAQRVVGTLCGARFELSVPAVETLRELLLRFREELALLEGAPPPAESKTPGTSL